MKKIKPVQGAKGATIALNRADWDAVCDELVLRGKIKLATKIGSILDDTKKVSESGEIHIAFGRIAAKEATSAANTALNITQ